MNRNISAAIYACIFKSKYYKAEGTLFIKEVSLELKVKEYWLCYTPWEDVWAPGNTEFSLQNIFYLYVFSEKDCMLRILYVFFKNIALLLRPFGGF